MVNVEKGDLALYLEGLLRHFETAEKEHRELLSVPLWERVVLWGAIAAIPVSIMFAGWVLL
jgi:hypothetical protein